MGGVLGGHYSMHCVLGGHYCWSQGDTSFGGVIEGQYLMGGALL